MKKFFSSVAALATFLLSAQLAFAHAVVRPAQVGIGAYQEFTLSVPSEKPLATTAIKLMIPDGITSVTPNVKPGWTINVKSTKTGQQVKDDDGMMMDVTKVSEIDWTGGSIPANERDTFVFQIQTPAQATTLNWKVYQTYSDGSVISWDQDPKAPQPKNADGKADFSSVGPYSQTMVVNDLTSTTTQNSQNVSVPSSSSNDRLALILSVVALVFSVWGMFKKKTA